MTSPQPEPATRQSPALSKLAAALVDVQAHLPGVAKDKTAEVPTKTGGKYTYTYADLSSIISAVLPVLTENGLAFTSFPTFENGVFVLRYQLLHVSGESLSGHYPLGPVGPAQSMGSAITYARRYCLCAVVGIAPDDDDDGAAAQSSGQVDPELEDARAAVRGAWAFQYGTFNQREAATAYRAYSKGGDLWAATPGQLRKYAAYLSNLPKEEAGSNPAETAVAGDQPREARKITPQQRGKLFALLGELDLRSRHDQLTWINGQLKTDYESRSMITFADAQVLIKGLESGIDAPAGGEPA